MVRIHLKKLVLSLILVVFVLFTINLCSLCKSPKDVVLDSKEHNEVKKVLGHTPGNYNITPMLTSGLNTSSHLQILWNARQKTSNSLSTLNPFKRFTQHQRKAIHDRHNLLTKVKEDRISGTKTSHFNWTSNCQSKILFSHHNSSLYPHVLVLTPVKNSASMLETYFKLLCSLNYPHNRISVALGEDSSHDQTLQVAEELANATRPYFRRMELHRLDLRFILPGDVERHDYKWQLPRRRNLAKARNQLLHRALKGEDWVLWIDSDLVSYPADLIQRLLSADKDIVTPACMFRESSGNFAIYDRNSWRETERSRNFISGKGKDYLMLEGYYAPTMRIYLNKLKEEGDIVPLDGVGGCTLLVRAKCFKDGLIFPPFVYEHHIETEGLAKMAKHFNCGVYGMPKLHVIHKGDITL